MKKAKVERRSIFVFRVSNFSSNPFKIGTTLLSEHNKREGG